MTSFKQMTARLALLPTAALALLPIPAAAQEESGGRNVMIGTGVQWIPSFPGADSSRVTFLPLVDTWRAGEPMTPESPDEAFGFAVLGKRNQGVSVGPALTFAPTRSTDDLPGLPKVGFGMEAGVFADVWPLEPLRLRAELRQGIGAHKALTGDLAADFVWRDGKEGTIVTAGPRVRWGSGIFGLYGYAGYDRLTGEAKDSPIVAAGKKDQFSAGLALTYRFRL